MRKLRIGVIDLVTKSSRGGIYGRVMNANLAGIMPQVVSVWCEQEGHDVKLVCYVGREDIIEELSDNIDIVFISAFTQTAQLAYALSNLLRKKGAITVIGGPHPRCYPEDCQKYFDYVLGFTDKAIIHEVLTDYSQHRPIGRCLASLQQPRILPGIRERWRFIQYVLEKAPFLKIIPMIGSLGCPYTCSFCIDASVPYQPLDFDVMKDDLRFLLERFKRPRVSWHDPNFGVRFNDYMSAIEEAVPANRIDFVAESSLALLGESNLKRLQTNGFKAILPGIESWYGLGNKSKTGSKMGMEKVLQVSDHVNMILRYIPYVQTNFVLGLDVDEGPEPFELTKKFIDMTPGTFPGYSLLTAFGRAAELNLGYQRENRVLGFPFHFLNNNHAMNVKPKNYSWPEFYSRVVDVTRYSFSWRAIANRFRASSEAIPRWMNIVRAISSEGFGRIKYHSKIRELLDTDRKLRSFFDQETEEIPEFYANIVKRDLGPLWQWLPEGALAHDPRAYLKREEEENEKRELKVAAGGSSNGDTAPVGVSNPS